MHKRLTLFFFTFALLVPAAAAEEREVPASLQQDLGLTIYRTFATVRDVRGLALESGRNELAFTGVSRQMNPDSASVRALGLDGVTLVEQVFDNNVISAARLLQASVGREVGVIQTHPTTGEERELRATVLAAEEGVVLRIGDRIHAGIPGRLVFDSLPPGLRAKPTLLARLDAEAPGNAELELTYQTEGLAWQADYRALLNDAGDRMQLQSRVTLVNQTGTDYRDASLRLVAGEPQRASQPHVRAQRLAESRSDAAPTDEMSRASVGDFHVYTLDRRVTLEDNQRKQIAFLPSAEVRVSREYRFTGNQQFYRNQFSGPIRSKAEVWLRFVNNEEAGLGEPLPAGLLRAYRTHEGRSVFMGENRIGDTADGEEVTLQLASTFDISMDRVQTDYKREIYGLRGYETAHELTVRNGTERDVSVLIREPIPGDWEMVSESHNHRRAASNLVEWRIDVPAKGQTTVTYRVKVR